MNAPTSRHGRRSRIGGIAAPIVLPWLVAAAAIVVAFAMWVSKPDQAKNGDTRPEVDAGEIQTLRLTLEASRGENQALRQELDRLLSVGRVRARTPSTAVKGEEPAPPTSPPADDPQLQEITKRLGDSLARFGAGDRSGMQTAAGDIFALVRRGKGALPALLDLYASATSPEAKKILLAPLLFIGGAEGRDFVMSQAETETDPALRKVLLDQSAKYATPDVADRAQGTFLERLQSDEDASTRLIAVRGLRYAQGADVQAALLRAAEDQDEKVRLAAMDVLASRPAMRKRLREIASGDPSAHVREIAQCRLMVADNMP